MVSYDLVFNSGAAESRYTEGANVSLIEINNSDQEYYQTGIVTLFDLPNLQVIGSEVIVKIDDTDQFAGYVARRQQEIRGGKLHVTYQLVGKTYDLWRYHTASSYLITGMTSYIASSLISTYATGISGQFVYVNSGVNVTEELDLSNTTIGDAIIRLSELDGFKFYVDSNDQLHYYEPEVRSYDFTITESEIVDMSPIEEADEDLANEVLVIGGSDYSVKDMVSQTHPSSTVFPSGILVAQRFTASDDVLSAVKLYLNRTIDPNAPSTLGFEIWRNASDLVFDDLFDNDNYINSHTQTETDNGELILVPTYVVQPEGITTVIQSVNAYTCRLYGAEFLCVSSCSIDYLYVSPSVGGGGDAGTYYIVIATGTPPGTPVCVSNHYYIPGDIPAKNWYFSGAQRVMLTSGTTYSWYLQRVEGVPGTTSHKYQQNEIDPDTTQTWYYGSDLAWHGTTLGFSHGFKGYGNVFYTDGIASSNSYTKTTQFMKITLDNPTPSAKVKVSGTHDGGTTWKSLPDVTWVDFGSESIAGTQINYYLFTGNYVPTYINGCKLEVSDSTGTLTEGGGSPQSGSKLEWSDDISFTDGDVPYPPSSSSWQTYTVPKLQLTENSIYWMVFNHNSSNSAYWTYYYDPKSTYNGNIRYSWYGLNYKTKWSSNSQLPSVVPSGSMTFQLGWTEGEITATAENQQSIDAYGRHFKIINDSTLNTLEAAQARADAEVHGMEKIPKKGTITIDGRTDMKTYYRFSSNLTNFGITDIWDVVSYTQRIDQQGFTTVINYGRQPWDLMKIISELE